MAKGDVLTCTYRTFSDLDIEGSLRLLPFDIFNVSLRVEISHVEFDIGGRHCMVRFLYHENNN